MNGIILTAAYFSVKFRHIWLCHILPGFQRIMMCYVTIVISYTIATIHVFDQWDTVQKLWPWAANFHQPQTSSQIGPKRSQRARIWCHSSRTETEAMASALKKRSTGDWAPPLASGEILPAAGDWKNPELPLWLSWSCQNKTITPSWPLWNRLSQHAEWQEVKSSIPQATEGIQKTLEEKRQEWEEREHHGVPAGRSWEPDKINKKDNKMWDKKLF